MATRLDSVGEVYSRTTNLPGTTAFTMMCWVMMVTDTNQYNVFLKYGELDWHTPAYYLGPNVSMILTTWNGTTEVGGSTLSFNTWYHMAITVAGTGANQCLAYVNGALDITNDGNASVTNEQLLVGHYRVAGATADGQTNGRFAAVKVWSAALTQAEINTEMRQYVPVRWANLNAWHPMLSVADDDVDFSANGNNLTVNGTLTTEEGPPIPWQRYRARRSTSGAVLSSAVRPPLPVLPNAAVSRSFTW